MDHLGALLGNGWQEGQMGSRPRGLLFRLRVSRVEIRYRRAGGRTPCANQERTMHDFIDRLHGAAILAAGILVPVLGVIAFIELLTGAA